MVLAIVGAAYLGRGLKSKFDRRELRPAAFIPLVAALVLAAWLASGLTGRPLRQIEAFLPPSIPMASSAVGGEQFRRGCSTTTMARSGSRERPGNSYS
jgi:hypothetical protein